MVGVGEKKVMTREEMGKHVIRLEINTDYFL